MARFVVVGESLVDLVAAPGGLGPTARPGGSPLNVAVGLGRLGHDVLLVTRLGDDPYGELLRAHVEASGARLAPGSIVPGARTSSALARLDAAGGASYEFDLSWELDPVVLPSDVDCVHVGSLGTLLEPGAAVVRELVTAASGAGVVVSYDPNVRASLVTDRDSFAADVARLADDAHVVKASSEDVAYLVGDGADVRWAASMVVVTHGADGVSVTTRSSWQVCPAHEVDVVDTIGAGDSFMAALLDGLARRDHLTVDGLRRIPGDTAAAAVDDAARAAAITCGRAGADPPTREELDASIAAEPA